MATFLSTWDLEEPRGIEDLDQSTQTVPSMSLTVREILTRFRRGTLDIDALSNRPFYDDEEDIDDDFFDEIEDLSDIHNLILSQNEKVSESIRNDYSRSGNPSQSASEGSAEEGPAGE